MYGRGTWGGSGANPFPSRLQGLWEATQGLVSGGSPYSEGIYNGAVACLPRVCPLFLYFT